MGTDLTLAMFDSPSVAKMYAVVVEWIGGGVDLEKLRG